MTTLFDPNVAPAQAVEDNTANGASELAVLRKRVEDKDKFIEELKKETAEYRKDLSSRMSLEELYAQRTAPTSSPVVTQPTGEREVRVDVQNNTPPVPTKDDVATLVREALSQELTKAATQNNIRQTKQELQKAWGDNFVEKLESRIQDLGIGKDFIDDVAGRSPKAVLALLGVQEASNPNQVNTRLETPPQSRRPANNLPVDNGPKGKSYYDNIRRTDPKRYLSPSIQIEMHNRAIALGPKFFEL